jgi:hypothetical protein
MEHLYLSLINTDRMHRLAQAYDNIVVTASGGTDHPCILVSRRLWFSHTAAYMSTEERSMSEDTPKSPQIDHAALHHSVDRIVASNLTTAIYTRLHTRQTQEAYDHSDFDDVAREVVREVINTYTALLGVFQTNPGTEDDVDNGR